MLGPALRVLAALLFFDLATPDTVDGFFYTAHVTASVLLFLFELLLAGALVVSVLRARLVVLLGLQFSAGLVAMFSQLGVIRYLSVGILVYHVAFAALLVSGVRDLVAEPRPALTMPAYPN